VTGKVIPAIQKETHTQRQSTRTSISHQSLSTALAPEHQQAKKVKINRKCSSCRHKYLTHKRTANEAGLQELRSMLGIKDTPRSWPSQAFKQIQETKSSKPLVALI